MANEIKFGTDGFRGIIAKDFTFENVSKITDAIALYLQAQTNKTIIIGYDPRFLADIFAQYSANILDTYGYKVLLSKQVVPTPIIAYASKHTHDSAGAIMFTASHNPREYLGIKFIPNYGGPACKEITDEIVRLINLEQKPQNAEGGNIEFVDFSDMYFKHIENLIDFESIKKANIKFIYDGLFSASVGYFDKLLKSKNINFETYNDFYDPNFGGNLPEPKLKYMKHTKPGYITLANDGDADRYGVIDENGNYVSPNIIMAILLKHMHQNGCKGKMVKTVGVSQLVDIVADKLGIETVTTPVGFKWICDAMRKNETIIGAEDSGGLSAGCHIPEKDGIYANLLILETMAKTGKTLSWLVQDILEFAQTNFVTDRVDIKLNNDEEKNEIISKFENLDNFGYFKIINTLKIDGIKFFFDDNQSWVLIRESGTEPLLRFYIESNNLENIESIKHFIKQMVFK